MSRRRPVIRKIRSIEEERLRSEMMRSLEAAILRQSGRVRASQPGSEPHESNVFLTPRRLTDPPPPWDYAARDSDLPTVRVARYEPEVQSLTTSPSTVRAPVVDLAKERETLPAPPTTARRKKRRGPWLLALAMAAILGAGLAVDPEAREDAMTVTRAAAARLWAALY